MTRIWDLRFACMLQVMSMGLFSTFEAVHMAARGLEPATIGMLLALESGLILVASPVWGKLADHTSRYRLAIAIGTLALAANLIIFALAESVAGFLLYAIIRGCLAPTIHGIMPALAVANIGPARPGRGFGRYRAFGSLGFMTGMAGLPWIFGDIASTCLAGAALLTGSLVFVRRLKNPERVEATEEDRKRVNRHSVGLYFLAYFVISLSEPGIHGFFGAYAQELGASFQWVGLLSSMTGLMALIGLPLMGGRVDRSGALRVLMLAFACQATRMGITSGITDYHWLWIPHLLHLVAWPGKEVGTIVLLSRLVPRFYHARVLSLILSIRMGGMMVGSFFMGHLVDRFGYPVMFQIFFAVSLLGLLLLVYLARELKRGSRQ